MKLDFGLHLSSLSVTPGLEVVEALSTWQSQTSLTPQGAGSSTFSSMAIGDASASRYVLVGIYNRPGIDTESITAVTVGGVSAVAVATLNNTNSGLAQFTYWIALVPTGTTADVVVTNGAVGDAGRMGVTLWSVTGLSSVVATDTASDIVVATTTYSTTIDVEAGGFIVGIDCVNQASNTRTWTGLTERFDGAMGGVSWSNASDNFAGALTGRTISTTRQAGAGTITDLTSGLFVVAMR